MADSVAPDVVRAENTCVQVTPAEAERRKRRAETRAHLHRLGHTIASWATANGYRPKAVYKVLGGELKGLYGESHDIAVKLGIKDGVVGANNV